MVYSAAWGNVVAGRFSTITNSSKYSSNSVSGLGLLRELAWVLGSGVGTVLYYCMQVCVCPNGDASTSLGPSVLARGPPHSRRRPH